MPIVPTSRQGQFSVVRPDPIEPTYLAMAAAMMHEQGRLFKPQPEVEIGSPQSKAKD